MKKELTLKSNNMYTGYIKTKILEEFNIGAGTKAVLLMTSGKMVVCEVMHYTAQGEWVVKYENSEYTTSSEDKLCSLVVVQDHQRKDHTEHPLKQKHWRNVIKQELVNSEELVTFELEPLKFKTGMAGGTCLQCTAYFVGSPGQSTCEECCLKYAEADLKLNRVPRKRKPRMISAAAAKERAKLAFQAAHLGVPLEDFEDWYTSNF